MAIKCPGCGEMMDHACTMIDENTVINAAGDTGSFRQYEHDNDHEPLSCEVLFIRVHIV